MAKYTGYIGTYDSPQSGGAYRFTLDGATGALSAPRLYWRTRGAKCVAARGGRLAVTTERDGRAGICLLDARGAATLLGEVLYEVKTPCFVALGERRIYTANYHDGVVMVYENAPGLPVLRRIEIAPRAGCHQALCCGKLLLVPCLELDVVYCYDQRRDFARVGAIPFPSGSGPRHGVFDRARERLYIVGERSNALFVFRAFPDGTFSLLERCDFLPPGTVDSASAAIRLSLDGRFLYVSTRGADVITIFSLDDGVRRVQQVSCGGSHPRDFMLAPDGRGLLVVNRTSREVVNFRRNCRTGCLEEPIARAAVAEGVGIDLAERSEQKGDEEA